MGPLRQPKNQIHLLRRICLPTGEAPYCEAKNDERKWCQKEDRSHGLVSTADTAHQGRRKKTMLRNCLGYFKESMQSWKPPLPPRLLPHYSLVMGGVIRLNLVVGGVIRLNNNSIYLKPDDLVLLLAECTASATPHTCLLRGLWQNVCFPLGKWTFLWPHLRSSCGVVRSRDTMVYIWNRMISYYYWRNAAHPLLHSSVAFQAKPSSHAAAPTSDTLTDTLAHHHGPAFTPSHCFHFTMPHTILATLI